jgi:hypothetical protein
MLSLKADDRHARHDSDRIRSHAAAQWLILAVLFLARTGNGLPMTGARHQGHPDRCQRYVC